MQSRRLLYHRPLIAVGIAFTISAAIISFRLFGLIQAIELSIYDRFIQHKTLAYAQHPPIILIQVTEGDIHRFGHPISDEIMAQLLEKSLSYNPAAIGLDIFRDIPTQGRNRLKSVLADNANIVLIEKRIGETVTPPTDFQYAAQVGFSDLIQDKDGVIRRALLMIWDDNDETRVSLSLALYLALMYLHHFDVIQSADPDNQNNFRLGNTVIHRFNATDGGYNIADDGGYQMLLDYGRGAHPFISLSMSEILDTQIDPALINGKIVIIGTTSPSVKDQHLTPYSRVDTTPMYGIEIHAHIADQLIRAGLNDEALVRPMAEIHEISLIFAFSLIGVLLGITIRPAWLFAVTLTIATGLFLIIPLLLFEYGYWVPVAAFWFAWGTAFLGGSLYVGYIERLERSMIMMLFGKFVTKKVALDLWKHRDVFLHGGRPKPIKLTATVIITDLKDYTAVAEQSDPTDVMAWLNRYMSEMTRIIEKHGGIVEDYAGDGIKATFGVPIPRNDQEIIEDAKNAVRCALCMGAALTAIHESWQGRGLPLDRLRVGICTGPVTAGSIGSEERMSYTTIGDTVNVAARLESFNKQEFEQEPRDTYRILVEESTWKKLGPEFQTDCIGEYYLKGRKKKSKIYRILTG
jgi:adenylate cyclase